MARLFSFQDGNFTAANGWKTIDATSYLNSVGGSSTSSTSYVATPNFAPGAITVEGIGLYFLSRLTTPTGTFDVQLWNSTGAVQVAIVTINVTDLPSTGIQYAYFKFAAPVLLLAATNYQVRIKSSVAGTVTLYRSATTGDWSRFLVTSTTATAAAADDFFVMGEHTGAGTFNTRTMTMDINSSSNYGFMVTGTHGVINFPTNANTQLRLSSEYISASNNSLVHTGNAIINQGTSGARIEASFNSIMYQVATGAANRLFALVGDSVWNAYGSDRRRITTLAATVAAGATSLTTNDTTDNWVVGDSIVIAGTRRNTNTAETRTTTSVGANSAGWTTGLTNARDGAVMTGAAADYVPGTVAAHIGNLTSNVIHRGVSTTLTYGLRVQQSSKFYCDNVLFTFQGATTSGTIAINSALAILDMNKCVFDNGTGTNTYCIVYTGTANPTTGYVSIRNSVFYGFQVYGFHISSASTLTGTQDSTKMVLEDNFFCVAVNAASAMVYSPANPVTLRRNIFNECRSTSLYAIAFVSAGNSPQTNTYPIEDNIIYNCALGASIMVRNNKDTGYACSGNVIFRCTTVGMLVAGSYNATIEGFRAFGNTSANMIIGLANIAENFDLDFVNCAIAGEGSYASQTGIGLAWAANVAQANAFKGAFYNCTFGNLLGASDAHTTADINFVSSGITQNIEAHFDDCELASTVKILNQSRMTKSSKLAFRNFNITDNDHRTYYQNGIIQTDTTITRSSPRSARFTPSSATLSTDFSSRKYALKAGQSATVGCYIRTSVIGDGAVYNGSLPQIILKKNYAAGIATDQVIGTATVAAAGAWELVTGAIPEVDIDCVVEICIRANGTTGWVNVEDFK